MKNEPNLDMGSARKIIAELYSLGIQHVKFIPKGEVAWCYKLTDVDNRAFLLRITSDTTPIALADIEKLRELDYIVTPIDDRFFEYGGYLLALYEFIVGETMRERVLDAGQMEMVGRSLAQLHQTAIIKGPFERKEGFTIGFGDDLHRCISLLTTGNTDGVNHISKLKEQLSPFITFVRSEYELLLAQHKVILDGNTPFVNCHGDPSPQNLIFTNDRVYFIDLDDLIYAPKEQDLVCFSDHIHFADFMKGYCSVAPQAELNGELRDWYGRKWFLGELTENCIEILCHAHTDDEYEHCLHEVNELLEDVGLI